MKLEDYATQVIRGTYVPHIDGIRALAVIPVILYHLWSCLCPGGYSGVDVFFVISGYLIGGGIIGDLNKGNFSFCSFYTRRIKRIMPAYFAMILVTLMVGLSIYHYEPLESLGNATLRSSYFFSNFFCYKFLGDYFAGTAEMHPLINLWSLSVEEQFYIIMPLVMLILWKVRKQWVVPFIVGLVIVSFIHAEVLLQSETARDLIKGFYMLLPRAWELLAGVLLACFPKLTSEENDDKILAIVLSSIGFLLTVGAYVFLGGNSHFPGYGALCSVLGSVLMIRYGAYGWLGAFLSSKLMVGIGRISYSLYLWHWPIIAYMHYIYAKELTCWQMSFAAILSCILSYASWKYVEMPIRRAKWIGIKYASIGLLITCLITGGFGALLYKTNGLVNVIHQEANQYSSLEYPRKLEPLTDGKYGIKQLNIVNDKGRIEKDVIKHLGEKSKEPFFVLIGDSHAEAMQIGFDDVSREKGISGLAVGVKTCPLYGIEITNTFVNAIEPFIGWLKQAPHIKTVIIMCRWNTRLSGSSASQKLYRKGGVIPKDTSGNTELLEEGLTETCKQIKALGKEVILLGPIPEMRNNPGLEIRRRIMLGHDISDIGDSITQSDFMIKESIVMSMLKRIEKKGFARIVYPHTVLINEGKYQSFEKGKLLYHDSNHLSGEGSRKVIHGLYEHIFLFDN